MGYRFYRCQACNWRGKERKKKEKEPFFLKSKSLESVVFVWIGSSNYLICCFLRRRCRRFHSSPCWIKSAYQAVA